MDVVAFFVTYAQATELEQPSEDAFRHTAMFTQSTAVFRVSFGDDGFDAAFAQRLADFRLRVVGAVGVDFRGALSSSAAGTLDRRDRIDQGHCLLAVMDVRAGVEERQRDPLAIAHNMPLRAIFAAGQNTFLEFSPQPPGRGQGGVRRALMNRAANNKYPAQTSTNEFKAG